MKTIMTSPKKRNVLTFVVTIVLIAALFRSRKDPALNLASAV